jgi:hypothetical protein
VATSASPSPVLELRAPLELFSIERTRLSDGRAGIAVFDLRWRRSADRPSSHGGCPANRADPNSGLVVEPTAVVDGQLWPAAERRSDDRLDTSGVEML